MDLSPAHTNARQLAQRAAAIETSYELLVAGPGQVSIDVHSGTRPAPGDPPGQDPRATLLVDEPELQMAEFRIVLPTPAEALILLSGEASWARVLTADGAWWVDMDVSDLHGEAPLRFQTTSLVSGAVLRLIYAVFGG